MSRIGRPTLPVLATLVAGLVISLAAALWQQQRNQEYAAASFDAKSRQVVQLILARMQSYEKGLRGARGVVVFANGDVDRKGFQRYGESRDIDTEFPGARGFGLIWRVPESRESEFVAKARRDDWQDFSIRQFEPHKGERYVLQYLEPTEPNRSAIGLDMASERKRREAALAAMHTGKATLTEPLTLVTASSKPSRSFVLLLPIYRAGADLTTPGQRESACVGWSFAPLLIDEVLGHLDPAADGYVLSMRDPQAADTVAFFGPPSGDAPTNAGMQRQFPIEIYGRTWQARFQATPAFLASLHQTPPGLVALVTAMLGGLCAVLVALRSNLAASALRAQLEQARRASIVANSDDAIVGATLDGVILDWNAGAERLFGYPADEAVGRNVGDLLLANGHHDEDVDIRRAGVRGERTPPFETRRRHRSGELIDVSISAAPTLTSDGRAVGYSMTLRDIREPKRAQQALAELNAALETKVTERTSMLDTARKDLQNVLDAVPSMIGYWDCNLVNRIANRAYSQWFGAEADAMLGRHLRDLMGDEIFELVEPHVEAVLRGDAQTYERSIPRPDGQGLGHSLAHYIPDVVDGEVRGFYVLVHDISELVEGQLQLAAVQRETEALLRTLHQHALVSFADTDGRITDVNDNFCAISGYTREELLGQDHRLLNSAHHVREFWVDMWRTISSGQTWRGDVCNRAKDGSLYWVNSVVAPFVGADGSVEKYISIRYDITPIKLAQQQAQAANQAKSRFLANMSHEIRTPMNAVIGLAYLLERTPLDAEQSDMLGKIKLASQSLLSIINDVLDLSKIEASEMQIEQAPFMLDGLLHELASLSRLQADAKGVTFELWADAGLPRALQGDSTRLRQVLVNLMSNAIKFTERGSVQLSVQALQATAERVRLRFEVKDSGVGIAPEALSRLFAPFVQADTSTTRRFGGTGLGLSIVKQLVTLMGGELGVNSAPRLGSEFWVELEFPVCDAAAVTLLNPVAAPSAGPGLKGVRVLVTDDSTINLEVARRILELEGARVWLAGNGQQAVDQLLADPHCVDVVLMDVQMPVLDGHDATRRIRSGLGLKELPIIALTAGITTGEHERARAAGMNDVVAKPFDPLALVRCIRKYVQVNEQVQAATQPQAAAPAGWPQIEGIDARDVRKRLGGDAALLRSMLRRLLEDFADIGEAGWSDPAMLARRLHNLKGSAGTLGAKAVEQLAAQAEEASGAGNRQRLDGLVRRLAAALADLRTASAAELQAPNEEELEQAPVGDLDGAALAALLAHLRHFDLAALDGFKALSPHLRPLLGPEAFAAVRRQVDNLEFALAAEVLQGVKDR